MEKKLSRFISYHFRRVKEYTQRYAHTRMNRSGIRNEILWELFELSNEFLRKLDIDYWVNYGTLLGFYREKDIIGHDLDIDFGCDEKFYSFILENRDKLPPELEIFDTSFKHSGPKLYVSYKGFDADIYFYRTEGDQLYSYEKTDWDNYNAPIPEEYVFPTQKLTIRGIETCIPANPKDYLKTIYGSLEKNAVRNPDTGYWE